MLRKRLEARIAEIADRLDDGDDGDMRDVIIQARRPAGPMRDIASRAAVAMRERMYSQSAREVMPPSEDEREKLSRMSDADAESRIVEMRSSMLAQAARAPVLKDAADAISKAGHTAATALLRNTSLSKVAADAKEGKRSLGQLWLADGIATKLHKDELAILREDSETIENVYPNYRVKVPDFARVASLPATVTDNKTSSYGIDATGGLASWGAYGSRGKGITVAVLDTGIDAGHPDLAGKLAGFAEFDASGNEVPGAPPHDAGQHGTHVTGTIVGGDANGSYIGMAPDAQVLAGLVLPAGGTVAQIIAGMQWAVAKGADVINMSLGGLNTEAAVLNLFTVPIVNSLLAGIPVVVAIGNDGQQTTGDPGNDLFAFAVGASDSDDKIAGFSGGRTHLLTDSVVVDPGLLPLPYMKPDISAPGVGVVSSVPGGGYAAFNGTSMATPHVAGAIALLLSNTSIKAQVSGPNRAFLIQDLLTSSVEELGENGQDQRFGFGRLNVLRAIGLARELGFA